MKKFLFILICLNLDLSAYEKIELAGQINDPAVANASAVEPVGDKTYLLSASGVGIYDSSYTFLSRIDFKTEKPAALTFANGLAYSLDSSRGMISAYDEKGKLVFSFGSEGRKNGQLDSPSDLKYFADGKIYVANTGSSRIEVFSAEGVYLYGFNTLKTDGRTKVKPYKICLDRSGFIYLTDPSESLVQKYDRSGRLITEKNYRADAIAVNDYGMVYIANEKEGKIKELDRNLSVISPFGTKGKGKFEFLSFTDLEIDGQNRLVLMDARNKKIMILELENSMYARKLPEFSIVDKIRLVPADKLAASAASFGVLPDNSVVYYSGKDRKAYLLLKDSKKDFFQYGDAEGQVKDPGNIVYYSQKIYVCDTGNSRAEIFGKDGKYDSYFGGKVGFLEKSKEGKFNSPSSITVDSKGRIYIADTGNSMVQAFNKDGIFLFTVGPDTSNFRFVKVTDVKTDEDNNLYVMDAELKKIAVVDSNGKYLFSWNIVGVEKPISFDYDGNGYFYILDGETSNVRVFDKKGNYIAAFFAKGKGDRELYEPNSLKIFDGALYISDPENNKIVSFRISYIPEAPAGLTAKTGEEKIDLSWQSANPAIVKEYSVLRGSSPDKMKKIYSLKKLSYTDGDDLSPDTTYYYEISALSLSGEKNSGEPMAVYFKGKEKPAPAPETAEDLKNKPPVEIVSSRLNYVFSANYKYYMSNPLGSILVKNNTEEKFSNLKVSFFLKDYMDFPSDAILPELEARTSAQVELKATLNNKILTINEDTPVQAQFSVTYYRDGKPNELTLNKPIKILSKNAITWDDTERIANFITVKDAPVYAYSRNILNQKSKFENKTAIDESLVTADVIWENLNAAGINYLADPVNPYSSVKSSGDFITDTVQFPRNTLKLKSGDCDDLTALIATLLESSGIRVMILDYPGHIALMFETGANELSEVGLPDNLVVNYENKYFVPVETTMLGKSLYDSVSYAARMYKDNLSQVKVVDLRKALSKFEPVTLPDTAEEFKYGSEDLSDKITKSLDEIAEKKFACYEDLYKQTLKASPDDLSAMLNLGILYAGYGKTDEAQKTFEDILAKEDYNSPALNDLGNVYFIKGDYQKAADTYMKAAKLDPFDENIYLNIARACAKQGKKEDAKVFIDRAVKINPGVKTLADGIVK